jgi:hypothetical protein
MTTEERFERIEHVTAGMAEQARKDREENRQIWRDTQRQLSELALRMGELAIRVNDLAEAQIKTEDRFRETDQRFRETDQRVADLVSAIGEWIRVSRKE